MQLYTNVEFIAFFLIYSLIGWLAEVCIMSIKESFATEVFLMLLFVCPME